MSTDLVFHPTGDRIWTATTGDRTMSLQVLKDITNFFAEEKKSFDDLHEALYYIADITGQRPVFMMNEATANVRTTC